MENFESNEILGVRIGSEIRVIAERAVRMQQNYHPELHDHLVEQAFVQVVQDLLIGLESYTDGAFGEGVFNGTLSSLYISSQTDDDFEDDEDKEDNKDSNYSPRLVYKPPFLSAPICSCGKEKTLVTGLDCEAWVCIFCTN